MDASAPIVRSGRILEVCAPRGHAAALHAQRCSRDSSVEGKGAGFHVHGAGLQQPSAEPLLPIRAARHPRPAGIPQMPSSCLTTRPQRLTLSDKVPGLSSFDPEPRHPPPGRWLDLAPTSIQTQAPHPVRAVPAEDMPASTNWPLASPTISEAAPLCRGSTVS